jgi:hypothetical protein
MQKTQSSWLLSIVPLRSRGFVTSEERNPYKFTTARFQPKIRWDDIADKGLDRAKAIPA